MVLLNLYINKSFSPLGVVGHNSSVIQSSLSSEVFSPLGVGQIIGTYGAFISKYYFYLKVGFILFLFILNLWLMVGNDEALLDSRKLEDSKQSTINNLNRVIKEYSGVFVVLLSAYTAQVNHSTAMSKEERENLKKQVDTSSDKCEQLQVEQNGLIASLGELLKRFRVAGIGIEQIKKNAKDTADQTTVALDSANQILSTLDQIADSEDEMEVSLLKAKLQEHLLSLKSQTTAITKSLSKNEDLIKEVDKHLDVKPSEEGNKDNDSSDPKDDINKSSIFNWDNYEEWFNGLSVSQQISFSLLIGQGVVFSALSNIIFIHYGEILINKFNLEVKYPKLATIIKYRRKFVKFYFINSCFVIFIIGASQIYLAISILSA